MKLSWLGHSGFRIEIEDQVLLLDPWLGNPLFDPARRGEAIAGATHCCSPTATATTPPTRSPSPGSSACPWSASSTW